MNAFIEALVAYLAPTAAGVILCAAIAIAAAAYQSALQRLPTNVRAQVAGLANTVTNAVEQKYLDKNPGGAIKKQEAMQMLLNISEGLGIPLNAAHASAAIESAIYAMNLYGAFKKEEAQGSSLLPSG